MNSTSRWKAITIAFLLGVTIGCGSSGPPLGTVTGTVTLNGEPLPGVNVTFVPEDSGSPSYGATDESGEYRLMFSQHRAGAEVGLHHVVIEVPEPETDDSGRRIGDQPVVRIPTKYRKPGTLTADVSSGRNEFDFELESFEDRTANARP